MKSCNWESKEQQLREWRAATVSSKKHKNYVSFNMLMNFWKLIFAAYIGMYLRHFDMLSHLWCTLLLSLCYMFIFTILSGKMITNYFFSGYKYYRKKENKLLELFAIWQGKRNYWLFFTRDNCHGLFKLAYYWRSLLIRAVTFQS